MQRRQTYDKLPLQANVYPMPTAMFIQDSTSRFSVLSAQALGVLVMKPGQWFSAVETSRKDCLRYSPKVFRHGWSHVRGLFMTGCEGQDQRREVVVLG